ncbi:ethylene-responsive transcription factor-like protein At4g13040 isoform X2 [Mercurialis annua]|nr:ethylene-responsive transcription factor-like protein At4g13040 isoform X2 [Mercurialis annua]XP_050206111.1 ethylene-responsive transcription factor-like protein At4g13040 isoform X2 [Mercurialis annua]XP_050206112.1 ethylene-responsive transcription factor-like protein At4g13040 isoform X2 [Mercurialis annua]
MVSIRRRKLLGLCAGRSSFLTPLPRFFEHGTAHVSSTQNFRSVSVHPLPSDDVKQLGENNISKAGAGSSNISACSSSKEQNSQPYPGQPIKRRKRHRRKLVQNQEPCLMRGVYFKNMKWQAAIKVDKKQIHLGTVGSQEEAARLYDRAAYMCGREPNFELCEEEKQELSQFKWDEFLSITRSAINSKKHKRRNGAGLQKISEPTLQDGDWDEKPSLNSLSASEDAEPDSSTS